MRRINHWIYDIDVRSKLTDSLPGRIGIVLIVPDHDSENIHADLDIVRSQFLAGMFQKIADDFIVLGFLFIETIIGIRNRALGRKPDVIELNLVNTVSRGLFGNADDVILNRGQRGIKPDLAFRALPDPSFKIMDRPFGMFHSHQFIFKTNDARDHMKAQRLAFRNKLFGICQNDFIVAAGLLIQFNRCRIKEMPVGFLHVKNDHISACGLELFHQILSHVRTRGISSEINPPVVRRERSDRANLHSAVKFCSKRIFKNIFPYRH